MDSNQTNKSGNGPFNWLEHLDAEIHGYPPYRDWDASIEPMFSFYVARYPFLRPKHPPEDSHERQLLDIQKELFWDRIRDWDNRLEIEIPRVIDGLNPEQRIQLAALVESCCSEFPTFLIASQVKSSLLKIAKDDGVKVRMLRRKLKAAIEKLNELRKYADNLDPQYGFQELPATIESCMSLLDKYKTMESIADDFQRCRDQGEALGKLRSTFADPSSICMIRLYWLFRHGCRISGDEAEVRVAIIREKYWTPWVEPVPYIPQYDGIENKGCDAVHIAVYRYNRD